MTPKKDAKELVDEFLLLEDWGRTEDGFINVYLAKKCALICVARKIDILYIFKDVFGYDVDDFIEYESAIKSEIERP